MAILAIRKVAKKEGQERVKRFDPVTGEPKLVNPATPGDDHEPWPLLGVKFEGEPPQTTVVSTKFIDNAVNEGWAQRVNERAVVRPAGPKQDVWNSTFNGSPHTFLHCDEIVFYTLDGTFRYRVTQQPDKYAVDGEEVVNADKNLVRPKINPTKKVTSQIYEAGKTHVTHTYRLERIDG